jgi:hypothetical protein
MYKKSATRLSGRSGIARNHQHTESRVFPIDSGLANSEASAHVPANSFGDGCLCPDSVQK